MSMSAMDDYPNYHSHGIAETAEVFDLGAEDEITELSEGKEDDEEHDSKTSQILSTARQGGAQLSHRLVETDVFEHLQQTPSESV